MSPQRVCRPWLLAATLLGATAALGAEPLVFAGSTATGKHTATIRMSGGGAGCMLKKATFNEAAVSPPAGVSFPDGLVDLMATGCAHGSTLTFTLTFFTQVPAGAQIWKYGPTSDDPAPHWYPLRAKIDDNVVTYSLTDGGLGDDDLRANGSVSARAGIGIGAIAAPKAPRGLTAFAGNGAITLHWTGDATATGYMIKRAKENTGPFTALAADVSATTYVDKATTVDVTYYYTVNATNGGVESDVARVQATLLPPKATGSCGNESTPSPRTVPCPPGMAGTIVQEEDYVCKDTGWEFNGWKIKESFCTVVDLGSASPATY